MSSNKPGEKPCLTLLVRGVGGEYRYHYTESQRRSAYADFTRYVSQGIQVSLKPFDSESEAITDAELVQEARIEIKAFLARIEPIVHNTEGRNLPCHEALRSMAMLVRETLAEIERNEPTAPEY